MRIYLLEDREPPWGSCRSVGGGDDWSVSRYADDVRRGDSVLL